MTMKFKSVSRLLLSVAVVMFTTMMVCGAGQNGGKCPKTVKVLVTEIEGSTFQEYKDLEKTILPWKTHEIKSPFAGKIDKVGTAAGSDVKTGDVLISFNDASIKKEIDAAKVHLNSWKKELSRREHWKVRNAGAESQAKQNVEIYTKLLAKKEAEMKNIRIASPIDGRIDSLKANQGDLISEGFVMGTIVNIDKVAVTLDTYSGMVSEGQKFEIAIKELSGTFTGEVWKDAQGRAIIVIENPEKQILRGMTAQFRMLAYEHKNAVVLPREKILADESSNFVYTVNGQYAAKTFVKIGSEDKGMALVLDGLSVGDELIDAEFLSVKEGTLKEKPNCVADNKKIEILVFDETTGKYVKPEKEMPTVKPVKKVVKPVVVEEDEDEPARAPRGFKRLRIGATLGYYKMNDTNFDEVYGPMKSFGADLSFMLTRRLDLWIYGGYGTKTQGVDWAEEDLKFQFLPISLDLRFFVFRSRIVDLFAGGGVNVYPFKDTNPLEDVEGVAFGFNILGGAYLNINKMFAFQCILRYNNVRKTIENADNNLNMDSLEALLGIAFSF